MKGERRSSVPAVRNRSSSTPKATGFARRDQCRNVNGSAHARLTLAVWIDGNTVLGEELVNKFESEGWKWRLLGWAISQPSAQRPVNWVFTILSPMFIIFEQS